MKKKVLLEILAFVLTLALLTGITVYLGELYMPPRSNYGATWDLYLAEQEDSIDLMFVGSSLAYCDIIPAEIYEKTGHTTYVVSGPYLKPDLTYYYLKEALRTQNPSVVLVEATSLFYSDEEADFYKANIGYMPFGLNRLEATLRAAPAAERAGLLFPLYNYHDRWTEYSPSDYLAPLRDEPQADIYAGYTILSDIEPQAERYDRTFMADDADMAVNTFYLQKIIDLCRDEGIELEFFVVPACEHMSDEDFQTLLQAAGDVPVTNYNDRFDELGLDLQSDFYDSRHLNVRGALKFSDHLADYITENFDLPNNPHDSDLWQARIDKIDEKVS